MRAALLLALALVLPGCVAMGNSGGGTVGYGYRSFEDFEDDYRPGHSFMLGVPGFRYYAPRSL